MAVLCTSGLPEEQSGPTGMATAAGQCAGSGKVAVGNFQGGREVKRFVFSCENKGCGCLAVFWVTLSLVVCMVRFPIRVEKAQRLQLGTNFSFRNFSVFFFSLKQKQIPSPYGCKAMLDGLRNMPGEITEASGLAGR